MKKSVNIILFILLMLAVVSCKSRYHDFDTQKAIGFTYPGNSDSNIITIPVHTTDWEDDFIKNNASRRLETKLELKSFKLDIAPQQGEFKQGQTFNFVRSVKVNIVARGLEEIPFASADIVDSNATVITLNPSSTNFYEYGKLDSFNLKVYITPTRKINDKLEINGQLNYHLQTGEFRCYGMVVMH